MGEQEALASVLVDHALAAHLVPWACPCDFGPEGRYRLEELVAASPHSLIYRATDRVLSSEGFDAAVAVKIFREPTALRDEALLVRRIIHPNVLAVQDRGTTPDGFNYLVAEFVSGGDLSQVRAPLPAKQAAALIAKVARAVQASHSAGVVHCDLKPSNILLTASGEPKLGDFGLARWEADSGNVSRGNLAFMSPEQFRGGDGSLTPPSDIFALGGLLYYLLVGELPLGGTAAEIATAHRARAGEPPPAPGIERDLDLICGRAMAWSREERHHSAGELADDLERWLGHEPIDWTVPSPLRRVMLWGRRRPVRALLTGAAILGPCAVLGVMQYNAVRDRDRQIKAQAESVRLAQKKVDETSARVRRQIEFYARSLTSAGLSDPQDQLLPALIWIEWLAGVPVIQDNGDVPGAGERSAILRTLIKSTTEAGRGTHLDSQLAKFALARLRLADGDYVESRSLLTDLERHLVPTLADRDPLRLSITAMQVCADANAAIEQKLPTGAVLKRLQEHDSIMDQAGGSAATRRLVQKVMAECRSN